MLRSIFSLFQVRVAGFQLQVKPPPSAFAVVVCELEFHINAFVFRAGNFEAFLICAGNPGTHFQRQQFAEP